MSISQLRKSSAKTLEQLKKAADTKTSTSSYQSDSRYWKPVLDKEKGKGVAIVRFLPAPQGEELPFVRIMSYNFKAPESGKYYSERSLVTIGKSDPYAEFSKRLWDTGSKENQDLCRKRTRRVTHTMNVLVIDDEQFPENNGKVFLYEAGPQIFTMITNKLNPPEPEFEDEKPEDAVDVFHAFEGADFVFRLVAKEIVGYNGKPVIVPDYEKSSFRAPSEIAKGDEDKIMEIWGKCYSLTDLISEDKFKSEDQLRHRMVEVLGTHVNGVPVAAGITVPSRAESAEAPETHASTTARTAPVENDDIDEDIPDTVMTEKAEAKPKAESTADDDFLNSLLDD